MCQRKHEKNSQGARSNINRNPFAIEIFIVVILSPKPQLVHPITARGVKCGIELLIIANYTFTYETRARNYYLGQIFTRIQPNVFKIGFCFCLVSLAQNCSLVSETANSFFQGLWIMGEVQSIGGDLQRKIFTVIYIEISSLLPQQF